MSAGNMLATARYAVKERGDRRRGQPLGDTAIAACTAYLEASRAVDDALEQVRVQLRPETTLEEDEAVERAAGDAWEALFLAAIELDTILPDPEHAAADHVRLMASLHNPPGDWTSYSNADGSRYYQDGRGRITAILTDGGKVEPGPWFKQGQTLPPPPW
jgi:hypothetical protein